MTGEGLPLVSVCVPVFNGARFLRQSLESIAAQTYRRMEIIVLDNASTDDSSAVAAAALQTANHPWRIVRHPENIGYAANCNQGIAEARGELIALFHADDIYDPDIVSQQVRALSDRPDTLGCFAFPDCITEDGCRLERPDYAVERSGLEIIPVTLSSYVETYVETGDNILFCPSAMVRASAYMTAGGYDSRCRLIEDLDMWLRLLAHGPLVILNRRLIRYRVHANQGSAEYRRAPEMLFPDLNRIRQVVASGIETFAARSPQLLQQINRQECVRELRRVITDFGFRMPYLERSRRALLTRHRFRFSLAEPRYWLSQNVPFLALLLARLRYGR